jgi:predicted phosphodiesterase
VRYAVLADIHGNAPALEAVLANLARHDVDEVLVLGDLVGYGAFPNDCVRVIAGLGAPTVAGNHDLIALGRLSEDRCIRVARRTLRWTRGVMTDQTREWLSALPGVLAADGGVVCAHGTLDDPQEYLTTPDQAVDNLARMRRAHPNSDVLLIGHTHRPWACTAEGRVLQPDAEGSVAIGSAPVVLNPGAVGQVRGGAVCARYLILDTDKRTAAFHAIPYDVSRTRDELRRQGLPTGTYRLRRSALGPVRQVARVLLGPTVRRIHRRRR